VEWEITLVEVMVDFLAQQQEKLLWVEEDLVQLLRVEVEVVVAFG